MAYVLRKRIWQNDTGVVLSAAGNIFLETGGQGRTSWVKTATWLGNEGAPISRETPASGVNLTVDTFRGWPHLRREHLIEVDLSDNDGQTRFNRVLFEWRGEHVVDATGITNDAALPANQARTWWYSSDRAWAFGSLFEDGDMAYAKEPFLASWSSLHTGKWYGPPTHLAAGQDFTDTRTALEVIGGLPLVCRSFLPTAPHNINDARNFFSPYLMARYPFSAEGAVVLSKGGLIWGWSANGTGGTSGFPRAGDKLGWVYEVGYPKGMGHLNGLTTATKLDTELSIAGLSKLWVSFISVAPAVGATSPWLNFATASATVRGRITAILIDDYGRP